MEEEERGGNQKGRREGGEGGGEERGRGRGNERLVKKSKRRNSGKEFTYIVPSTTYRRQICNN